MQKTFAERLIEKRSIDYIPIAERHGKVWHLWPCWFSGDAHLATVATGAVGLLLGGNLFWMTIAVVLGCAFGTFFMAFHSTQGPQLGLPQMIQSRPQFGYIGALLVWGVALVSYIGFNAFNQLLAVQTVQSLYGGASTPTMLVFTVVALSFAIVGYDTIHFAQRWVAYVMIGALLVFTVAVATQMHFTRAQLDPGDYRNVPFLAQFFAAAAYQISWSVYVSDYSRYLPRDVGDSVLPGFGKPLLVCSLLGLVTITSLNFYGASLTLLSVIDSIRPIRPTVTKRMVTLIFSAVVSVALALAASDDFFKEFGEFLAILLYLFTPWTAINLVDFYIVRKGHYSVREIFNPRGMYGRWNWRGLVAYGVGFAAMIPFFSTGIYRGPVARALGGADIAMLIGLPVSALVYIYACRSMDLNADRRQAAAADVGLDP